MQKPPLVAELTDAQLAAFCQKANLAYRRGQPIISDTDYDFIYLAALKQRLPDHFLLHQVEPEGDDDFSSEKVVLPQAMLSLDKAYHFSEIEQWLTRIVKAADELSMTVADIIIKATPKLDGFAGFDDGTKLYTRGDGQKGSDISRAFQRGLRVFADTKRGQGAGEIVVKKSYFQRYLADDFLHPRNFQASLIKEKALDSLTQKAIDKGAALFVPFCQLPYWSGTMTKLRSHFDDVVTEILTMVDFDVDGVVFEVVDVAIKTHMGSNRKNHRWQIAFKENKEKAQVRVLSITAQVGRTGKITPVAELEPTKLSGAMIRRATAHHYGFVRSHQLGEGGLIELTRSGQVIPKIVRVLSKGATVELPKSCPSCQQCLTWQGDFLMCLNHDHCSAQIKQRLLYFFQTLANSDGFGAATIEQLYAHNVRRMIDVYHLSVADFKAMSFGDKTSENLVQQLKQSRKQGVEDWRFLSAFGIERLALGNCQRLLMHYALMDVFQLSVADIAAIEGFAEISAQGIVDGLARIKPELFELLALDFHLLISQTPKNTNSVLSGKTLVFTGKMPETRQQMITKAQALAIRVAAQVSSKTDYLVVGADVGRQKLTKAKANNVKIISVQDYLAMINE